MFGQKNFLIALTLFCLCFLAGKDAGAAILEYEKDVVQYSETTTLKDVEIRRQFLDEIEEAFLKDYNILWARLNMTGKLSEAIERSLKARLSESWVLESLQVAMDLNSVVQHVQDTVPLEFSEDYTRFLVQMEEYFADTYLGKLRAYDKALQATRLGALVNVPSVRLFFEEQIQNATAEGYLSLTGGGFDGESDKRDFSLAGTAAFVGVMLGRKLIQRTLARKAVSVIGRGFGKKLLAAATGVGTVITLAWALYDVGSFTIDVWDSPKELQVSLLKHYEEHYRVTCPQGFWQVLRNGVRSELDDIWERMARRDDDTKAILASPAFRRQTAGLSSEKQQIYIDMLISVKPLDNSVSYSMIAENFGSVLMQAEKEDVGVIREILSRGDLLMARQWFALAGRDYCSLFRALPREVWDKFQPNRESLKILSWLSGQPKIVRQKIIGFPESGIRWIMEELPDGQAARLFFDSRSQADINAEMERMKKLPRDLRIVWQSKLEYALNRARQYLGYALGGAIGLLAALGALRLRRKGRPRIEGTKEERV